ncbi:AAA family ATPase [Microbispora hainanensis]|uniref:AAA family ATPase n=1 Tax=Microbispora hainanensis TaxID=568844 RepID=A0ABZ1SK61_9ACTN|nr:AAA family ATPase [Microbispora hainanensis]
MIVLRGNSGSGKTSVARAVRAAYGRGLALVGQDVVRRELLRERDVHGGVNIGLIDTIVRYSLDHGYHVLLEGILTASRYGEMLQSLHRDHAGTSAFFYLDVSLPETLRRHDSRPLRSGAVRGRCHSVRHSVLGPIRAGAPARRAPETGVVQHLDIHDSVTYNV